MSATTSAEPRSPCLRFARVSVFEIELLLLFFISSLELVCLLTDRSSGGALLSEDLTSIVAAVILCRRRHVNMFRGFQVADLVL
jgi:hypothetical protein